MLELDQYKTTLGALKEPLEEVKASLDLKGKQNRAFELEKMMEEPTFWNDAEKAAKVTYLPQYKGAVSFDSENIQVIQDKPLSVEGTMKADRLVCAGGSYAADGIFFLREAVAPDRLVPGLAMDGKHVQVDRKMATSVKGCFACGDITGTPYQYIKSAGEGNVAALSAVDYLASLK